MSTPSNKFFNRYEFDEDVRDERDRLRAVNGQLRGELVELCFKADTALRYLRAACEGLLKSERGSLQGFIDEMERRVVSSRTIAEAHKATGGQ